MRVLKCPLMNWSFVSLLDDTFDKYKLDSLSVLDAGKALGTDVPYGHMLIMFWFLDQGLLGGRISQFGGSSLAEQKWLPPLFRRDGRRRFSLLIKLSLCSSITLVSICKVLNCSIFKL